MRVRLLQNWIGIDRPALAGEVVDMPDAVAEGFRGDGVWEDVEPGTPLTATATAYPKLDDEALRHPFEPDASLVDAGGVVDVPEPPAEVDDAVGAVDEPSDVSTPKRRRR